MFTSVHLGFPPWTWKPNLAPKIARNLLVFLVCPSHGPQPLVFSSRTTKGQCVVGGLWCILGVCCLLVRERCGLTRQHILRKYWVY